MTQILIVGFGGFLGSVLRYLMSGLAHRVLPLTNFPIGTLTVNVIGCFLIGLANGLFETRQISSPQLRLFLLIGIFGGFTTFSSFGYETLALASASENAKAVGNIILQIVLGLGAVWIGNIFGRIG